MKLGYYLHTSWEFEHPFAVRSWSREDFQGVFELLRELGFDTLMLWPLSETMPPPLSSQDAQVLRGWRDIIDDASTRGLATWIVFCPNVTTRPEIAEKPFVERHFYPFKVNVRLDDDAARDDYFAHRADIFRVLDNADAYVTIDGDPGGYPNARAADFGEVFLRDRALLDSIGRKDAQLVPWLWSGWGSDWEKHGAWREPIEPLTESVLDWIKQKMPEPFTLLPGRSIAENWANGRVNFALTEAAELIEKSVLLCYELIEYEPTPPAVCLQFDDIRRVLRQEKPLLEKSRGLMGNAQQPIMALPNLFFFARSARDENYLNQSDEEVLRDLADFLGGDADVLLPAWLCGHLPLEKIPADLPAQLASTRLRSQAAQNLPGGAEKYLGILAAWSKARLEVLRACETAPQTALETTENFCAAMRALVEWWRVHRYVLSGEMGTDFRLEFTHPILLNPLREWLAALPENARNELKNAAPDALCAREIASREAVKNAVDALLS